MLLLVLNCSNIFYFPLFRPAPNVKSNFFTKIIDHCTQEPNNINKYNKLVTQFKTLPTNVLKRLATPETVRQIRNIALQHNDTVFYNQLNEYFFKRKTATDSELESIFANKTQVNPSQQIDSVVQQYNVKDNLSVEWGSEVVSVSIVCLFVCLHCVRCAF